MEIGKTELYNKIILIQEFFIPKDQGRFNELLTCLKFNLNNELIDEIHLIMDVDISGSYLDYPKIKKIIIGERLTFKKAFDYGNTFDNNTIKIVSNNDISFEKESLQKLKKINLDNCCLALTRYNIVKYKPFMYLYNYKLSKLRKLNYMTQSQDAWIFCNIKTNDDMNFFFGLAGCDNYIAYLLDKENVKLINNSLTIKIFHHHMTNIRYYDSQNKFNKLLSLKAVSSQEE